MGKAKNNAVEIVEQRFAKEIARGEVEIREENSKIVVEVAETFGQGDNEIKDQVKLSGEVDANLLELYLEVATAKSETGATIEGILIDALHHWHDKRRHSCIAESVDRDLLYLGRRHRRKTRGASARFGQTTRGTSSQPLDARPHAGRDPREDCERCTRGSRASLFLWLTV